ncbi:cytochrome c biogenesis protein CcsA [Deinococcus misasensis]|uniref:cytochrome c biogenesis protein CcsA n=1 Tax=Deinococcus misasensis TaxID=392413 RepID=UPI00055174A0|nr:cytochrome c biogenesis protein CcsA [Deinococcus misasensis]
MKDKVTPILGILTLLSFAAGLFYAFTAPPDIHQKELVRIFYLHMPVALMSYVAYFVAMGYSLAYLITKNRKFDRLAYSSAEVGVLFTALTLIGGSLWAKPTWGTYWTWDPRLTTTAIGFLIYVGYFIIRGLIEDPDRRARVGAVIGIVGTLYVPINYMSVYWWRSIHQTPTLKLLGDLEFSADPRMGVALMCMFVAFVIGFVYFVRFRAVVADRIEAKEDRLMEQSFQEGRI